MRVPDVVAAIALMALAPLHNEFGIKRCIMSTYQVRRALLAHLPSPALPLPLPSPSLSPLLSTLPLTPHSSCATQAASGAGAPGMKELEEGSKAIANGGKAENSVFAHPLPFNVIPHIDKFLPDMYTKEERKVRLAPECCRRLMCVLCVVGVACV